MILHDEKTIQEYTAAGHWGARTLIDTLREQVARHWSGPNRSRRPGPR